MNPSPFYITGIGSSAGGIIALKSFFESIDDHPGTAFIIIQHLAADQKGFTKDILKSLTNLPLTQLEKKTKIEINHVYLIPPANFIVMDGEYLVLTPRSSETKINNAIDVFFKSLAEHAAEKAIGIIFSGLGSDGAKGAQSIKEKGGVVMVQSPESANFSSMPLEAIITDHPDVIAPPELIAKELLNYIKHPSLISAESESTKDKNKKAVEKIISLVNEFSGVNFRDYKRNTILRRIDKRFKINEKRNLEEYFKLLSEKPDEIRTLYNDLLIGVTEFFRDKGAFDSLSKVVIPQLCGDKDQFSTIRVWVAGCSTGEEAYSLAMLLDRYIKENNLHLDFKIFATDLNQKGIDLARQGRFSKQIGLQVPEQLLKTCFIDREDFYEIIQDLRKKIVFSVHNLLCDPPFLRMDLITCRNLFIYLTAEVQKKTLYSFNYALNDKGYLMIGANESQSELVDLFETIDNRWKIYKNKGNTTGSLGKVFRPPSFRTRNYQEIKPHKTIAPMTLGIQQEFFAELLLEKYAPACILLTEKNEVVYVTGAAEELLTFPKRKSNLNLFDMVQGHTGLSLRSGLRKVREEKRNVVLRNVRITTKNEESLISDFFFYSIYSRSTSLKYIIVEVKRADENKDNQEFVEISTRENIKEIARLEAELNEATKELQFHSDELETVNEELQSSNEEMKSSNEEMQTTNEELQSSNEELKSVNFELKSKIEEITVLHDDVQNLFVSTQIATLFLDKDLKIRKFTPAVQAYFNIRENDLGRPIHHYTYNFKYQDWKTDVEKVLQNLHPLQKEIETNHGYALLKIAPYKTDDRRIEGVVITFVDITDLKQANLKLFNMTQDLQVRTAELEDSEKLLKTLVENTPDIVARVDKNANVTYINQSSSFFGIDPSFIFTKSISELETIPDSTGFEYLVQQIMEVLRNKKVINFYHAFQIADRERNFYISLIPEWDESEGISHVLLIARDITDLRAAENKLDEKNNRLQTLNQNMDSFVHAVAHDLRSPITNLKLILTLFSDVQSEEKRALLVEKLNHSVIRIDDIINGLIEIIDSEVNISEREKKVSFTAVIDKVLNQFKNEMPEDAVIDLNIKVEEIKYIRGYLVSIIRNFVSNCIKYRKIHIPLVIKMETWEEGIYKVFSIEDNGMGMDLDDVKSDLFKPFKRLTSNGDGKGLGLHLVRAMIEKTGGKIEVESEEGRGSRFYVYFKDLR